MRAKRKEAGAGRVKEGGQGMEENGLEEGHVLKRRKETAEEKKSVREKKGKREWKGKGGRRGKEARGRRGRKGK